MEEIPLNFLSDFHLKTKLDLSKQIKVRDGYMWAITEEKNIFFADFNSQPIRTKLFTKVNKCDMIFPSPLSYSCAVHTSNSIVFLDGKNNSEIVMTSDATVQSIGWLIQPEDQTPVMFMGHQNGRVAFCQCTENFEFKVLNFTTSHRDGKPSFSNLGEIMGISITPLKSGEYAVVLLESKENANNDNIVPFIISPKLELRADSRPSIHPIAKNRNNKSRFFENGCVALNFNSDTIYHFSIDKNTKKENDILKKCAVINKKTTNTDWYCPNNNFFFIGEKNLVTVFSLPDVGVDDTQALGIIKFESPCYDFDYFQQIFYVITGKEIKRYNFDILKNPILSKETNINFAVSQSLRNNKLCLHYLNKAKLPLSKINSSLTDQQKFGIYDVLCKYLGKDKFKVRCVSAMMALTLRVRMETAKDEPNVDEFVSWASPLIEEKLVTFESVRTTLEMQGWTDPIEKLLPARQIFDLRMMAGNLPGSIQILKEIKDDDEFVDAAVRIFPLAKREIVEAVIERGKFNRSALIPVLISKDGQKYALTYGVGVNVQPWLRREVVFEINRREDAEELCIDFIKQSVPEDRAFAFREWTSSGRREMVGRCLAAINSYKEAAITDPDRAAEYLPKIDDAKERRRVAIRVLRSMPRDEAAKLAKYLMTRDDTINLETLLQFLPDDTPVGKLEDNVGAFISAQREANERQAKIREESIEGIDDANRRLKAIDTRPMSFLAIEECDICHHNLLTEGGIVFPCGHHVHRSCVVGLLRQLRGKKDVGDPTINCPVCGFVSCLLINAPFRPSEKVAAKWSTDIVELQRAVDPPESNLMPNLNALMKIK